MRFLPPREAQCSQGGWVGEQKFTRALRQILNSYLGSEFLWAQIGAAKQRPTQLKLLCNAKGRWTCVICLASIFTCLFAVHCICPSSAYKLSPILDRFYTNGGSQTLTETMNFRHNEFEHLWHHCDTILTQTFKIG